MRCRLQFTAAFATVTGHQPALLRIEMFILRDDPLVKTACTQGLAFGFFGRRWLPELDNVSHGTPFTGLIQSHPFEPGFDPLDKRLGLIGTH